MADLSPIQGRRFQASLSVERIDKRRQFTLFNRYTQSSHQILVKA
jgi:hypothetical protein